MPELSQHVTQERIKSLVETVMLESIYYVRAKNLLKDCVRREGPEDTPLTKLMRGVPAH